MKPIPYNQYLQYYTRNACTLVTFLNIFKYSFWIQVIPSFIIKFAIFFDGIAKWFPKSWATFWIIYPSMVWYLNKKLGLNFKLVKTSITRLHPEDRRSFSLWIKWYSTKKWKAISFDWYLSIKDMDYLIERQGWVWHNAMWDWNNWWMFQDTNGSKPYKFPYTSLKYAQRNNLVWDTLRTVVPNDKFTKWVCRVCIKMFMYEQNGKMDKFYKRYKNSPYLEKAKLLYFYGR